MEVEAIAICLDNHDWEGASQLLKSATNLDKDSSSLLLLQACDSQSPKFILELLLQRGCDLSKADDDGVEDTALHVACFKNASVDIISLLVANGAQINAANACMETPLHHAIQMESSLELIQYLVDHGADVNARNLYGETALHLAVKQPSCDLKLVEILIQAKGDLNLLTEEEEDVVDVARRVRVSSEVFECLHQAY